MSRSIQTLLFSALLGLAALLCWTSTAQSQDRRGERRGNVVRGNNWRDDGARRGWDRGYRGGYGGYGHGGYGYGYPYYGSGYYGAGYYPGYYSGYYTSAPGAYVGVGPVGVGVGAGGAGVGIGSAGFGYGWW